MNLLSLPWIEISVLIPIIGAIFVRAFRTTPRAYAWTIFCTGCAFVSSMIAWGDFAGGHAEDLRHLSERLFGKAIFGLDELNAPLVPLTALLHLFTLLCTAKVKMNRMSFGGHLVAESLMLATFACREPLPLLILLALGTLPPLVEMFHRGNSTSMFAAHGILFIVLTFAGWIGVQNNESWGSLLLAAGLMVRNGTFPTHLWVANLFDQATFGTALLYVVPLPGVYAVIRLVLPIAPDWLLKGIGIASMVTTIYAAGLATVARNARRFFANFLLSISALVLVGLELDTPASLTGALCMWTSAVLSLGGLGLTLRALEARHGRMSLIGFSGMYGQTPALAVGFLLAGLGCVGFPGTLGFVSSELLLDGSIHANLAIGVGLVLVAMLNGIAIVRAYYRLFTGTERDFAPPLAITFRERLSVLMLCALVVAGGLIPQPGIENRHKAAMEVMSTRTQSANPPAHE